MGATSSLASLGLNLALSKIAADTEADRTSAGRKAQIKQIKAADAEAQRQQAQALERRIAQQRAKAGASGVGGVGGSIDAVVRGLTEESASQKAANEAETKAKINKVNSTYSGRQATNLLDFNNNWLGLGGSTMGLGSSRRSLLD